jgi:Contractile injection system tube protein/LysM domain
MTLSKAYFQNLEPKNQPSDPERLMEVQFNPTELSFSKSAQFAEIAIPGLDSPIQQFIRGGTETLTVELFFDTTESGMGAGATSVTDMTDQFYQLVKQDPNTHAPPRCRFGWGQPAKKLADAGQVEWKTDPTTHKETVSMNKAVSHAPFWFTCVVESIDRKFLLFSPEGKPLRARLTVKMREYKTIEQSIAKLQTADHTKMRIMKRRERLDQLSAREYDTPADWRRIAEANDIDDPRRVPPGTILKIPPIDVAADRRRRDS